MRSMLTKNPFGMLSNREQEVLQIVARDKTDREIAHQLGIRERTVRAHVSRIMLKLGVASRVGAAVAFVTWKIHEEICQCDGSCMTEEPMATSSVTDMSR
jgi:DNA-binding NarL/FixJ family response regulator